MIDFIKSKFKAGNGILVFSILLFVHLLPLFSVAILHTLDGPSHLYNAKLFNELWAGNESVAELFKINNELVPNYTGHFLLSLFLSLTTPIIALKIVHLMYVIGLAFSFRSLVLTLNPKSGLLSVLIFPFIYSELFLYGFYNFSIAIIFLFITSRYWIVNYKRTDFRFYSGLVFLFLVTYLSHSFTFILLCLTIGIFIIVESILKREYWRIFHFGTKAFLLALPSIVLSVLFVVKRESTHFDFLSWSDLWEALHKMSCLKKFEDGESFYLLWFILIGLTAIQLFKKQVIKDRNYTLLILALLTVVLYFFMPNDIGYAGVFSIRLLYIAILFLITWLAVQNYSKLLVWIVVIFITVFQFQRLSVMTTWSVIKNNRAKEMMALGELIPKNSIVKPIRTLNVWDYFHLSNYMGVTNPHIILENYEATHDYFPVMWKHNLEEKNKIQTDNFFKTTLNGKEYIIDYLVVIGEGKTDNELEIKQMAIAEEHFPIVYQSYFVTLYKVE